MKSSFKETQRNKAAEKSMTQAIMQAALEVTKTDIMAIREVHSLVNNASPLHTVPRSGAQQ